MKNGYTSVMIKFIVVFIISASVEFYPATKTWTGNTNTDWGNARNWDQRGVPGSADLAIIPANPTGGRFPSISSGSYTVEYLTIRAGALVNQSNGTLRIINDFTLDAGSPGGTYNQTGGLLEIADDWRNSGVFNSTGGTVQFTGPAINIRYSTFAPPGTNQFYNIIVDPGIEPDFDLVPGSVIKVSGNFTNNNSDLDNSCNATFVFNGSGAQTIYSASTPVPNDHTFGHYINQKTIGSTTLLSDISITCTFTPGVTHTNLNGNVLYVNNQVYNGPLPVELVSFNASVRNNVVLLNWKTATETNNYGFEIERSFDSNNWTKIGFVNGHGNSNSPKEYFFEDQKLSNASYQYRLKQIDNDGAVSYSKIVNVTVNLTPNSFALSQNYPNPFNPSTKISWQSPVSGWQTLKVYDILGNEIATLLNEFREAGFYEVEFSANGGSASGRNAYSLTSGVYIYKINVGDPESSSGQGFSETKKMLLTK